MSIGCLTNSDAYHRSSSLIIISLCNLINGNISPSVIPILQRSKNEDFLALPKAHHSNNTNLSFGHATGSHANGLLNFSHNILIIISLSESLKENMTASGYNHFGPNMSLRY